MNTKDTLPISEARKNIFKITENVQKTGSHYTLTERGVPKAVIMSVEEFDSWQETAEVMRDFPDLKRDIQEAEKDLKTGHYITLEQLLAQEGYVLADKPKKKYAAISSRLKSKGKKRSKKFR